MRGTVAIAVLAGCSFDPPGGTVDGGAIDGPVAAVDAPAPGPDATVIPVVCPDDYGSERDGSVYKIPLFTSRTWLDAEHDCEDDTDGQWSHLVAVDDMAEWDWGRGQLRDQLGSDWYWIGVVRDAGAPTSTWRSVTGGVAPFIIWRSTPSSVEPNNGSGTGTDEPVVAVDSADNPQNTPALGGYLDISITSQYPYVCECDGKPPVAASY